jgi:beta-mannosidase
VARILSINGVPDLRLEAGWQMAVTEAGSCATPEQAAGLSDWIIARVPGTAAATLKDAGRLAEDEAAVLHDKDVWWCVDISASGPHRITFDGIATLAEIWLDGRLIATSRSMFVPLSINVDFAAGSRLWICCRALTEALAARLPRARWRTRMIPQQALRGIRTTLLGQAPGWMPPIDTVGPWRDVHLQKGPEIVTEKPWIRAWLDPDGTGRLSARLITQAKYVELHCAGQKVALQGAGEGVFTGELVIPDVVAWWPHTHGNPALYAVTLVIDGVVLDLGRTGFRRIEQTSGADGCGFGLMINGAPVFCRGACWTSTDPAGLKGGHEDYRPWLELAREAGANMIRMSGTGAYETPAFYALCDELGLMVWQDFMFANFDYPFSDADFAASVQAEADAFLSDMQLSPSIVVLCGGSEMYQQATMMGLSPSVAHNDVCEVILPEAVNRWLPDTPYVVNAPSGGPLPFSMGAGVTHYFGVGAYRRPLEDARRADVRFATECVAFAQIPGTESLRRGLPGALPGEALWKARTPRDAGADWDFEDVRDHYLALLHGVDADELRRSDPALYLDLSREAMGEVMTRTYAEWRRPGSNCAGALVWTLNDMVPGAGWGLIDSFGVPKSVFYALKRAWRPLHLGLTDEGCDGLGVHLVNETQIDEALELELICLKGASSVVFSRKHALRLAAGEALSLSAFDIIGSFFDLTYAYRFGPRGHDATIVRLRREGDEAVIAEAIHYPAGADYSQAQEIKTALTQTGPAQWRLELMSSGLVHGVFIEAPGFRLSDDGFDLTPGLMRRIDLTAVDKIETAPAGHIRSRGAVVANFP